MVGQELLLLLRALQHARECMHHRSHKRHTRGSGLT